MEGGGGGRRCRAVRREVCRSRYRDGREDAEGCRRGCDEALGRSIPSRESEECPGEYTITRKREQFGGKVFRKFHRL
eukprot:9005340-Pyramimonas_sp.AAC.1